MIPTMILIGLAVGSLPRPWWVVGFGIAPIAWPFLLIWSDVLQASEVASVLIALALAAVNAAVGVAVARGVAVVVRAVHPDQRS